MHHQEPLGPPAPPHGVLPATSQYQYSAFFGPWEPPPTFCPAPTDQGQIERLQLVIKHCLANGPSFLATVKQMQGSDPGFAFLFGGDGSAYFKWALYCASRGVPPTQDPGPPAPMPTPSYAQQQPPQVMHVSMMQPPGPAPSAPAPPPQPPTQPGVASMQLTPEVEAGFTQVLDALSGSKDAIKSAQQWFMGCGPASAGGLARMMALRCVSTSTPFEKQMHIVYLVNDILFKGLAARAPGSPASADPVANALQPFLGAMLAATYSSSGKSEEVHTKLSKILAFWSDRHVYDSAVITSMQHAMHNTDNPAGSIGQALAQQAAAAATAKAAALAASMAAAAALPPPPAPPGAGYPGAPPPAAPWGAAPPQAMYPPPGSGPPPHAGGAMPWQQGPPPPGAYPPPAHMYPGMHPAGMHPGQHMQPHMQPPGPHQGVQGMEADGWGVPPDAGHVMGHHYMQGQQGWSGPSASTYTSASGDHRHSDRRSESPPPRDDSPPRPKRERASRFHSGPVPPTSLPPRDIAASPSRDPSEPQPEPVSSFTFPPGLLPALCKRRQESGGPAYEPLMPEEIEAMGLPPPPVKDDYLASRLERFFAEVRDYRPGLTRADIDDPSHSWHRQRLRREYEQDPEGLRQRWWRGGGRRHGAGRGEPGRVHADGTFTGSGSMYAGLGVHVVETAQPKPETDTAMAGTAEASTQGEGSGPGGSLTFEDMYNAYRNIRSGGYHKMIMHNAAKSQMNSVVPPKRHTGH